MSLHRVSRFAFALGLCALPAAAGAQAFGLNEIGTCATSRAFANTGAPCDDASTIYWNPGAVPGARGLSVLAGAAAIALQGDFTMDTTFQRYTSDIPTAVVPHVFANYRTGGRFTYGLGVYVPYGLTSQWGDEFPGRFAAKKASLQSIYVQPNVAYQIGENWSVGVGPVVGRSSVELIQGIDLSQQKTPAGPTFGQLGIPKRTEFARATLKGDAVAFGVNVGVHGRLTPNWEVGLRFLSPVQFKYDDADATFEARPTGLVLAANNPFGVPGGTPVDALLASQFTGTGALTAQKVNTKITHPAQIEAGFGYRGFRNTVISVDYAWVGWKSAFQELPVDFQGGATDRVLYENYNNTSSLRVGVDYRFNNGAALRGGFAAAASAAPDVTVTPLLPEQDRQYATIGGGYPITSRLTIEGAYMRILTPGRRGRIDERTSLSQTADQLNIGAYTLNANIFSFSLKASL